ncbi:aromatic ring-hydroxylating dioxygenase subunit alpha [Microcoleus sp. FACHB-1515]|uniref:aromatic ring-hydroxylating dioxygenase subunit alpha n=1 Tax=Cyanophyceae TaxID=3028117 RepID=UPI0016829ADD|nr:aromatic ring-hydroxylating dioxygenase subunit alpha [Microcoleus sp. FACHB-1515]MBD2090476.1 aromatic ring-hydroxylating dioxygenase subunit alpha [Microcoleus sp. FACHB-1515]
MTSTSDRPTSSIHDVRQAGINPNHWYVVAQSSEVTTNPIAITLWNRSIVLFRDSQGKINALEDRCPHRQVKLSHGVVKGDRIECAYHGWCFDGSGKCVDVPYLEENQKLPSGKIQAYPVREQDGFIWLFPGEKKAESIDLFGIPEWDHLNYIATVSVIDCNAHYSYLIENLMDMYHGHLHDNWQAWADPVLQELQETSDRVDALYQAQSYYKIDKIWSISQLFFPALRRLHPEPLNVSYVYPHWVSTLGNDFKIYCLFCPRSLTSTRAYLIHFTSLNAFWRLHKLPVPFRRFVKNRLFGSAQKLLDGLVRQDVLMIEEEQQAYLNNPQQRGHEFNRTLASVQRLIRAQADLEEN